MIAPWLSISTRPCRRRFACSPACAASRRARSSSRRTSRPSAALRCTCARSSPCCRPTPGKRCWRAKGSTPRRRSMALARHAAHEQPQAFALDGGNWIAPILGWAVDANGSLHELEPARTPWPEVGDCLRSLPAGWRRSVLLSLAFGEDFAILDGLDATIPWLAVALPSHWAPERQGRPAVRRGARPGRRQQADHRGGVTPGQARHRHRALGALRLDHHPSPAPARASGSRRPGAVARAAARRCACRASLVAHRTPDLHPDRRTSAGGVHHPRRRAAVDGGAGRCGAQGAGARRTGLDERRPCSTTAGSRRCAAACCGGSRDPADDRAAAAGAHRLQRRIGPTCDRLR